MNTWSIESRKKNSIQLWAITFALFALIVAAIISWTAYWRAQDEKHSIALSQNYQRLAPHHRVYNVVINDPATLPRGEKLYYFPANRWLSFEPTFSRTDYGWVGPGSPDKAVIEAGHDGTRELEGWVSQQNYGTVDLNPLGIHATMHVLCADTSHIEFTIDYQN